MKYQLLPPGVTAAPASVVADPFFLFLHLLSRLRLAKMNEEMREAEGPYSQSGQYNTNSPTEMQYRKCMQEFISLQLDES